MEKRNQLMHPPKQIIYSDKDSSLLIRALEEQDANILHEAIINSMKELLPFMEWSHHVTSVKQQVERIRKTKKAFPEGLEFDFGVFDDASGEFLMCATLSKIKIPNRNSLRIGYWTSSKHCNKGLATIVTKILIITSFEMGCDRVEIGCNASNQKSIRVIEKCGFKFEGASRNYYEAPSSEMIRNGMSKERTCLQYALVPEDISHLSWYSEVKKNIKLSNPRG